VASHATGLDQRPGTVTDRRDQLVRRHEVAHGGDRLLIDPQIVRVGYAAGQQQRVELIRLGAPIICDQP
jgi:hypothetical protein